MLELLNIPLILNLSCFYSRDICLQRVDLILVGSAARTEVQDFGFHLPGRMVSLVYLIKRNSKEHSIEEDDLCEPVNSFTKCELVVDGLDLPESLLLD